MGQDNYQWDSEKNQWDRFLTHGTGIKLNGTAGDGTFVEERPKDYNFVYYIYFKI